MPLGKMTAKTLGKGGVLQDAIAQLDPTSVLREVEAAHRFGVPPAALAQAMGGAGLLDQIAKATFSDDDLINTHPAEMTDPMLRAAQARINEDEEFARRYRAVTDYTPKKSKDLNF